MNIIIVGCGMVGQTLAEQLNEEGNNITVIDVDADLVNTIAARNDILGIVGNGATHTVQEEAGIDRADLLIAVTNSDELNLLCCMIAKKAGNCQTIARIKNPEYSTEAPYLKDELGLAMVINPEHAAAEEIARVLRFPAAIKIDTFAKGRVELVKFRLPEGSPLVGLSVREIIPKLHCDVLICTVERGDDAYIAKGDFVFADRDVISLIASPKNAAHFFEKINYKQQSVKDAIILGGGILSQNLCELLSRDGIQTKLIEEDEALCNELCTRLPGTIIINGDPSSQEVLMEEGLVHAGALVALTEQDEENILISLFAKSVGDGKLVTKITRVDFDNVIKHLDLDSTIYPKNITSDMIVRFVRAMKNTIGSNVETLYNVIQGEVEAAEFIIRAKSPIIGIPLAELKFKENVLIAAILREKKVLIPRGNDIIQAGDSVIVVSKLVGLHDISDILK